MENDKERPIRNEEGIKHLTEKFNDFMNNHWESFKKEIHNRFEASNERMDKHDKRLWQILASIVVGFLISITMLLIGLLIK